MLLLACLTYYVEEYNMKEYTLSQKQRKDLKEHHRAFQAAVAIVANRKLNLEAKAPYGIYKQGGGVLVNDCEIAIHENYVQDDWKRSGDRRATPEESATVEAIHEVAAIFKKEGAAALKPYAALLPRHEPLLPDSLRLMFGNC
jgi:hypothetical protein